MRGSGFTAFDLDKTFSTNGLITTSRMIDIGRIILQTMTEQDGHTDGDGDNALRNK
jgi:hypothetical protein